jgi:protein CpxP
MKTPSKFLLVLSLLALGFSSAALRAEEDGEASEDKKERRPKGGDGEKMKTELGLTDAQAEQMKAIHEETESQMKAIRDDETMSMEDKKAAGKKLHEATKAKIDAILSAEQKAKFSEMREKGGKGEKRGRSGAQ